VTSKKMCSNSSMPCSVVRRALEVDDPAVHLLAAARAGSGEDD
jgi:hypothetical protein